MIDAQTLAVSKIDFVATIFGIVYGFYVDKDGYQENR